MKSTYVPQRVQEKAGFRHSRVITTAGLVLLGMGTGIVSLLLGASVFGMPMFLSYFSSPLLILLSLLPPVLLTLFLYCVSGRAWTGFLVPALVILTLSLISYFKMQVRAAPLYYTDFQLANEAGNTITGYSFIYNWKVWVAAAYIIVGTIAAFLLLKHKPPVKLRLIGAAVVTTACVLLFSFVYTNNKVYASAKGSYEINPWSKAEQYIVRGFVFPFLSSTNDAAPQKPDGYDKFDAAEALAEYGSDVIPEGKKVNVVSVMLESYADFSVFDAVDFNMDVYGPLHELQQESVHGSLVDNVFAGGTINTERSFLTGYTALDNFTSPENSYVYYFREQGYHTEGFHAGDSWFYDRKQANANIGFDRYYFLEDYEEANRWDGFFFSTVLSLYEARDPDTPYFAYNLSYQNHGPYDAEKTSDTAYIMRGSLTDKSYNILNNYLEGVYNTTQHISDLIDYFRGRSEPVVVVLFGDHKPWLGDDSSVYKELGINIDQSTEEGFYNFYATPYIIWANDAAKSALDNDFTGFGGDFSPCFLMNKLFEECGFGGNAFMKAADALRENITVVNTATGYFAENGVLTAALSADNDRVYKNYMKIEYYWQHNFTN